jgi:hypothetical protein
VLRGRAGFSVLRCSRRASFSRRWICFAFSRSRFAIVVFPARPMAPSFASQLILSRDRLLCLSSYLFYEDGCDDSVAPRRLLLPELGVWLVVLDSRSAVRERVPWPNPLLAMFDTCRRISSIEVVRLVSIGPGRPSTSHRIFGFRVARARLFLILSARHPVDRFIYAPL